MIGQKAAICGLVLVGVTFDKACDIVGCCDTKARQYVPRDWQLVRGTKDLRWRWRDAFLEEAKRRWHDLGLPLHRHGVALNASAETIRAVARREGWPTRQALRKQYQSAVVSPLGATGRGASVPHIARVAAGAVILPKPDGPRASSLGRA